MRPSRSPRRRVGHLHAPPRGRAQAHTAERRRDAGVSPRDADAGESRPDRAPSWKPCTPGREGDGLTAGRPDPVRCVEWAEVRVSAGRVSKSSQAMPPALQFLVLTFAGWVNRHQDDLIAYLREEHRVLREHPRAAGAGYRPSVRRGSRLGNHFPAAGILRGPWPGRTADPCATGSQPAARSSYGEDLTMWKPRGSGATGKRAVNADGPRRRRHTAARRIAAVGGRQQDGETL